MSLVHHKTLLRHVDYRNWVQDNYVTHNHNQKLTDDPVKDIRMDAEMREKETTPRKAFKIQSANKILIYICCLYLHG